MHRLLRPLSGAMSALALLFLWSGSAAAQSIDGYQLVSQSRVTLTQYDYTFRATLTNGADVAVNGVELVFSR